MRIRLWGEGEERVVMKAEGEAGSAGWEVMDEEGEEEEELGAGESSWCEWW